MHQSGHLLVEQKPTFVQVATEKHCHIGALAPKA